MSYVADGFNGEILYFLEPALHLLYLAESVGAFIQFGGQCLLLLFEQKHDHTARIVLGHEP